MEGPRFLRPSRWEIRIEELGDGRYRLLYRETVRRPGDVQPELFGRAARDTVELTNHILSKSGVKAEARLESLDADTAVASVEAEGPLDEIALYIIGEFLAAADFSEYKFSIRDFLRMLLELALLRSGAVAATPVTPQGI